MSPLRVFAPAWFGNFRFKEFGAIVMAALALGHEVASQVGVEGDGRTKVAVGFGVVAAVCYILNPKYAEWATATVPSAPSQPADASDPSYGIEHDPLDESRDKDAQLSFPYTNSSDQEGK